MKMNKVIIIILLSLSFIVMIPVITPFAGEKSNYDIKKACEYITENAAPRSKTWCAWHVMRAMHAGGCPIYLLPAHCYSWLLPQFGFNEIDSDKFIPQKGDIAVFPAVKGHFWGHIQMWNGKQWVSDFKQKSFYAAKGYIGCKYRLFRRKGT